MQFSGGVPSPRSINAGSCGRRRGGALRTRRAKRSTEKSSSAASPDRRYCFIQTRVLLDCRRDIQASPPPAARNPPRPSPHGTRRIPCIAGAWLPTAERPQGSPDRPEIRYRMEFPTGGIENGVRRCGRLPVPYAHSPPAEAPLCFKREYCATACNCRARRLIARVRIFLTCLRSIYFAAVAARAGEEASGQRNMPDERQVRYLRRGAFLEWRPPSPRVRAVVATSCPRKLTKLNREQFYHLTLGNARSAFARHDGR